MAEQVCETYLVDGVRFPFCKGCGHTLAVKHVDKALALLHRTPASINLVSDIGCIGLVDALFADVHTVHTTHGRSTAFAAGIEIADGVLGDSDLKTLVLIGDGGATIGLLHVVHAAQLNVDITVIVCNNYLYGMTGGQHSAFSPCEMVTTTTPAGNIVPPLDICKIADSCEAGFVARALATDGDLPELLAQAIAYPGFALVEVLGLCTEFGTKIGGIGGKQLKESLRAQERPLGVLARRNDRQEFSALYQRAAAAAPNRKRDQPIQPEFTASLEEKTGIVLAGTAGERVQLASYLLMRAAIASGLRATQKNDNPVTQGSGFSLSEVILSPEEIHYTASEAPRYLVVTSEDGLREITANGILARSTPETILLADAALPIGETQGTVIRLPLRDTFGGERAAVGALGVAVRWFGIVPPEAFEQELHRRYGKQTEALLEKISALAKRRELAPAS